MIEKTIVEKLIHDNDMLPPKEQTDECNSLQACLWGQEKLALKEYIAKLPFEEILDIVTLMDCGRECIQMQSKTTRKELGKLPTA